MELELVLTLVLAVVIALLIVAEWARIPVQATIIVSCQGWAGPASRRRRESARGR